MFLVPLVVYGLMTLHTSVSFSLTPFQFTLIVIQGVFFSYLGNMFSLKGIEYAPNPGYSLILSKSYVVFTAIASIFLFSAPLTVQSILAIGFIIAFSAVITIDRNKNRENSNPLWLPYTLGAFFCWGFLALSSKYLLDAGVPILTRLVLAMAVTTILIMAEILYKKVQWKHLSRPQLQTLFWIGILGASFNYYMQAAFHIAPNVGFVNAANAGSISLLTVLSAIFFKDELTLKKMIGILGVTVGLMLLFL